jgi:hypothetical protein
VLTFFGFKHPKFVRAVGYYRVSVLFSSGFMLDSWMKRPNTDDIDFSSLKMLPCGGSYIPPEKFRKYTEFARDHGYKGVIQRGYGMSETGGAQLMVPDGCMDDVLGFPVPEEDFLIQDEDDGNYYKASDGVRTGILYIASDSLCQNTLDGEVLFEYTVIDGRNFICTNDMVRANSDGSFSYAGRADKYFVNNDGVRFNAGAVETEIARQPGIEKCAVVPVLEKRIHDTVPALYIVPEEAGSAAIETVRKALVQVFIEGGLIKDNSLPSQFVLVDEIPCNANGKLDVYRITRDRLKGKAYNIVPVHTGDAITDIEAELTEQLDSITGGTLPEGMDGASALGIYDLFNSVPPQSGKSPLSELWHEWHQWRKRHASCRRNLKDLLHNNGERKTMFNFYDDNKNPFMCMMNMSGEGKDEENPMQFMQQAFSMQMQMMQTVMNTQMQMMKTMADAMGKAGFAGASGSSGFPGFGAGAGSAEGNGADADKDASEGAAAGDGSSGAASAASTGFKLGKMNIPPELLSKLMQMDMTPENLEKLQGVLDFMFNEKSEEEEK